MEIIRDALEGFREDKLINGHQVLVALCLLSGSDSKQIFIVPWPLTAASDSTIYNVMFFSITTDAGALCWLGRPQTAGRRECGRKGSGNEGLAFAVGVPRQGEVVAEGTPRALAGAPPGPWPPLGFSLPPRLASVRGAAGGRRREEAGPAPEARVPLGRRRALPARSQSQRRTVLVDSAVLRPLRSQGTQFRIEPEPEPLFTTRLNSFLEASSVEMNDFFLTFLHRFLDCHIEGFP